MSSLLVSQFPVVARGRDRAVCRRPGHRERSPFGAGVEGGGGGTILGEAENPIRFDTPVDVTDASLETKAGPGCGRG